MKPEEPRFRHLFGPVPSRRFRRSPGIDVTPHKTCSLDCLFCQLGHTTNHTTQVAEYVPASEIASELEQWLSLGKSADYLTFAGSGEPTLYAGLGALIEFLRHRSPIPIAVLSNGTLLFEPSVRAAITGADVVKVSCSAWDEPSFRRLNRPSGGITFEKLVQGITQFRDEFRGQLWLEVMIIEGVNSNPDAIGKLAAQARAFRAERIHLNTCVRPPADPGLCACSNGFLQSLLPQFGPTAEVIADYSVNLISTQSIEEQTIVDLLKRRPCTADQMAASLGVHPNELAKHLGALIQSHRIKVVSEQNNSYYVINSEKR